MITQGFLQKLAVVCKDHYVLRTIDDLFLVAGAELMWWQKPLTESYGDRITRFYGWTEGIKAKSPRQYDSIIINIACQIADNQVVPQRDRDFITTQLSLIPSENNEEQGSEGLLSKGYSDLFCQVAI